MVQMSKHSTNLTNPKSAEVWYSLDRQSIKRYNTSVGSRTMYDTYLDWDPAYYTPIDESPAVMNRGILSAPSYL